eukprot:6175404-Pleurochrysis_carterae.AAC.1
MAREDLVHMLDYFRANLISPRCTRGWQQSGWYALQPRTPAPIALYARKLLHRFNSVFLKGYVT